jgi:hypothetical protein
MNAPAIHRPPCFPEPSVCGWGQDRGGLGRAFEVAGVVQVQRWIAPGEFAMGSPADEPEREPWDAVG